MSEPPSPRPPPSPWLGPLLWIAIAANVIGFAYLGWAHQWQQPQVSPDAAWTAGSQRR